MRDIVKIFEFTLITGNDVELYITVHMVVRGRLVAVTIVATRTLSYFSCLFRGCRSSNLLEGKKKKKYSN